jgi:hypothetical protein
MLRAVMPSFTSLSAMRRPFRRLVLALACTGGALMLLAPASGMAAQRRAPQLFFGTQFGESALAEAPAPVQDQQVALMAASGVQSVRVQVNWALAQPAPGVTDWSRTDNVVRVAASHGLDVLATVVNAPRWASTRPQRTDYQRWPPTSDPRPYTNFLVALIQRYGRGGSFWTENPAIQPARPIRAWQIWNEPGFRNYFGDPRYRRSYPRLLRASYNAIKRTDRTATVVMAGLANSAGDLSWEDLDDFYRAGVRRHYDVLALHPYASNVTNLLKILAKNRQVLRRRGEGAKRIWLTEVTWPAAKGKVPRSRALNLDVTRAQQSRNLVRAYRLLGTHPKYRVRRMYWFSWATTYRPRSVLGSLPSFEYAGLTRATALGFQPLALLSAYARVARQLGG